EVGQLGAVFSLANLKLLPVVILLPPKTSQARIKKYCRVYERGQPERAIGSPHGAAVAATACDCASDRYRRIGCLDRCHAAGVSDCREPEDLSASSVAVTSHSPLAMAVLVVPERRRMAEEHVRNAASGSEGWAAK